VSVLIVTEIECIPKSLGPTSGGSGRCKNRGKEKRILRFAMSRKILELNFSGVSKPSRFLCYPPGGDFFLSRSVL